MAALTGAIAAVFRHAQQRGLRLVSDGGEPAAAQTELPTLSLHFARSPEDPEVWAVAAFPILWFDGRGTVDVTRRTRPAGYLDDPHFHAFHDGEHLDDRQMMRRWWDTPDPAREAILTALRRGVAGEWVEAEAVA